MLLSGMVWFPDYISKWEKKQGEKNIYSMLSFVFNQKKKEYIHSFAYICPRNTGSINNELCCTPETNVCQLYFN